MDDHSGPASEPLTGIAALKTLESKIEARLGFLAGHATVPDDFDEMGADTIEALFEMC